MIKLSRYKQGNPKRASRFLCLHCMKVNQLSGIQRISQREKYHVKDLICISPECRNFASTKNMEIRWCDTCDDVYKKAAQVREIYYPETENI